ncbi:hypothetical protein H2203_004577 [Taxawa tesnikishii (nom. ined.)]|nr:hypothetical protein H2203_004577 [Dothideales sp. JES 119]
MAGSSLPSTIRIWQYTKTRGGLEKNLKLNSVPAPTPNPDQHLVQVIATALNPVDYKVAELPVIGSFLPKPATPGIDFAGRIVTPASNSAFKRGDCIVGATATDPMAGGGLSEYILVKDETIVAVPQGIDPVDAAAIPVAGLSAYQSVLPHVKQGDNVFINGGSGGTGVFGIQIAKASGTHVTTTCSTVNVELCRSLGADRVIDYKKEKVVEALNASGVRFDHVVDNVGSDMSLYWRCHEYTKPSALYVYVGHPMNVGAFVSSMTRKVLPGFLGGGKRRSTGFLAAAKADDLRQIVKWMEEGKVRSVIDSKFAFDQVPQAFERLKTGRAKGKIIVLNQE